MTWSWDDVPGLDAETREIAQRGRGRYVGGRLVTWTAEDDATLMMLRSMGLGFDVIGRMMGRSVDLVAGRAAQLRSQQAAQ